MTNERRARPGSSALAAMVERRALPTRHDARPLLLEIGRRLSQDAGRADLEPVKRRISASRPPSRRPGRPPSWTRSRWPRRVRPLGGSLVPRSPEVRLGYTLEAREHLAGG
jgi:hypothetical protein